MSLPRLVRTVCNKSFTPPAPPSGKPGFRLHFPRTKVPEPRDHIRDVDTFLKHIGRDCQSLSSKFDTWESLFKADAQALKEMGLNSRQRKYVLLWTERYRQGWDLSVIKTTSARHK